MNPKPKNPILFNNRFVFDELEGGETREERGSKVATLASSDTTTAQETQAAQTERTAELVTKLAKLTTINSERTTNAEQCSLPGMLRYNLTIIAEALARNQQTIDGAMIYINVTPQDGKYIFQIVDLNNNNSVILEGSINPADSTRPIEITSVAKSAEEVRSNDAMSHLYRMLTRGIANETTLTTTIQQLNPSDKSNLLADLQSKLDNQQVFGRMKENTVRILNALKQG